MYDYIKRYIRYAEDDEASRLDRNETELFEVCARQGAEVSKINISEAFYIFSSFNKTNFLIILDSNVTIEHDQSFFEDSELSKRLGAFRFSGSGGRFSSTSSSAAAQSLNCQSRKLHAISGAATQQQQRRYLRVLSQC